MYKRPAVTAILDWQAQELSAAGLQAPADMVSTTVILSLVLQQCARILLKEGLGEALRVQVIADASSIFKATINNGGVVVMKVRSVLFWLCV
jgi:hypothetical protein